MKANMYKYYAQYKQDLFLDKVVFNGKNCGFFIDIGAHDGISFSNSYFFEKNRFWEGICIEPNPAVFSKLSQNRNSTNLNICIGEDNQSIKFTKIEGYAEMLSGVTEEYAPEHLKRIKKEVSIHGGKIDTIEVEMKRLETIDMLENRTIDFISIDTEGNELGVLKSINFKSSKITCVVVENNYNDNRINKILIENNYILIARLKCDNVFVHKDKYASLSFKVRLIVWKSLKFLKKIKFSLKNKKVK